MKRGHRVRSSRWSAPIRCCSCHPVSKADVRRKRVGLGWRCAWRAH
jgi:hypothetical protein